MDSVLDGKVDELVAPAVEDLFGSVWRTHGERSSTTGKGVEVEILKPRWNLLGTVAITMVQPIRSCVGGRDGFGARRQGR